jgi:hypothetical protein
MKRGCSTAGYVSGYFHHPAKINSLDTGILKVVIFDISGKMLLCSSRSVIDVSESQIIVM